MPDDFLTQFEMSRLEIDPYGSIVNVSVKRKALIIAFFLFTKNLVARIFLQPDKYANISKFKKEHINKNLKIIGTAVQTILKGYFDRLLPTI